jgi:hypothetical protein
MNRITIKHGYQKRPSWRKYGEGVANVEASPERDGSVSIHAMEWSKDTNTTKEVFVSLPKDKFEELAAAQRMVFAHWNPDQPKPAHIRLLSLLSEWSQGGEASAIHFDMLTPDGPDETETLADLIKAAATELKL